MQSDSARAQRREAGARGERDHDQPGHAGAEEQDLEGAHVGEQLARRDRHGAERQHGAAHSQHPAQRRRGAVRRAAQVFFFSGFGPVGAPALRHSPKPPSRCSTFVIPMSASAAAASTPRQSAWQ